MKKALAILLVYSILMTLLVVSPFTANADEKSVAETGDIVASGTTGDCTWTLDNGVLTISGNGKMEDNNSPWRSYDFNTVVIESGVTSIGSYAFLFCTSLTSVNIPDSVTSIGGSAFEECTSLTSVTIPDSVTSIGISAFYNTAWYNNQPDGLVYAGKVAYKMKGTCPSEVVIKDGTLGISDSAFRRCTGLTSVTIPNSVTSIGNNVFSNCTSLTSIDIPDSVTSIGRYAFSDCTSLTSITIPDSVTSIGTYAFSGCTGLTSVTIPDSVTSIGGSAFSGCTGLTSVTIPDSVTSIGSAFSGCTGLTSVTIPDSVTSIGGWAFSGCKGLTSVTIPDSVEAIGASAFYDCTSLTSVTIPASANDIYDKAFGYYYKEGFGETKVKDFTVYGYKGSEAERYANDNNFKFIALDDEPSDPTKTTDREIFGDIDGDGAITVVDSTFLQRYTIQAETPYPIGEKMK